MKTKSYIKKYRQNIDQKIIKYRKEYRKNNKIKISNLMRKYRKENKEEIKKNQEKYRHKNKQNIIEYRKEWYKKNKNKCQNYSRRYYQKNIKKLKKQNRQWKKDNKEKILKQQRKYKSERMKVDINFRLSENLRGRIYHALKRNLKSAKTQELLGCTIPELKRHLEKKFKQGMNWENWGLYGWHIDHIKPCYSFDLSNKKEQQKCFHYKNLRPLWAEENLKRRKK